MLSSRAARSGIAKRGSNSRPQHWQAMLFPYLFLGQGCALPTELLDNRNKTKKTAKSCPQERKTRLELATPTLARLCSTNWAISANLVKEMRLELTRQYCHYPLKVARLPIPPFLQIGLKSHCVVVPRTRLELARLSTLAPETSASTIPPPGLTPTHRL